MSTVNISIPFDEEKLKALDFTLGKDNTTAQKRVEKMLLDLYENTVPEALREYVDSKSAPPAPKPKRPMKSAAAKATPTGKNNASVPMQPKEEKHDVL